MPEVIKTLNQRIAHLHFLWWTRVDIELISISLLWLFTLSALIGMSFGYVDWFLPKTPLNLLVGFILLVVNMPIVSQKGAWVFFLCFAVGMGVEILGVHSGQIFGEYYYGENLGFKVADVPLMIGIYWAVLVLATNQIARHIIDSKVIVLFAGAAMMVALDFCMEQLASPFDFWHFAGGLAGWQNYLAWFVVAVFLQFFASSFVPKGGQRFASHLFANQVAFFALSYLIFFLL